MSAHNISYLLRIALIGALGGFLFGYDWVAAGDKMQDPGGG